VLVLGISSESPSDPSDSWAHIRLIDLLVLSDRS
jgi:hypothetical protein